MAHAGSRPSCWRPTGAARRPSPNSAGSVGETGGTFKATLQDVLRSIDGGVVGIHRNTAERNGKHLDVGCCIVFEVEDGRITDAREYFYDLNAWDEFWS